VAISGILPVAVGCESGSRLVVWVGSGTESGDVVEIVLIVRRAIIFVVDHGQEPMRTDSSCYGRTLAGFERGRPRGQAVVEGRG
jgi:hypothetical protein